jgi:hypothetical protein
MRACTFIILGFVTFAILIIMAFVHGSIKVLDYDTPVYYTCIMALPRNHTWLLLNVQTSIQSDMRSSASQAVQLLLTAAAHASSFACLTTFFI